MNFRETVSGLAVETIETTTKQSSSSMSQGLAIGHSGKKKAVAWESSWANPTSFSNPN